MYLGLYSCPPPGKAVDPRTPDKRDAKRRRHATCADQAAAAALLARIAMAMDAAGEK